MDKNKFIDYLCKSIVLASDIPEEAKDNPKFISEVKLGVMVMEEIKNQVESGRFDK